MTLDHNLYYNAAAPPRWQRDGIFLQTFDAYQQAAGEKHSRFVDPCLVGAADAHLRPGSPAIDAGVTLRDVPADLDGVARPRGAGHDIGAFETIPAKK